MGGECGTRGRKEKCVCIFGWKIPKEEKLEDVGVDGRLTLRCVRAAWMGRPVLAECAGGWGEVAGGCGTAGVVGVPYGTSGASSVSLSGTFLRAAVEPREWLVSGMVRLERLQCL